MKISFIGNILNLAFIFGKFFNIKGHDVKVYIDKKLPEYYQPRWEHPDLNKLPDWVEIIDVDYKKQFFGKNEKEFIRKLRESDIIHAIGEDVIWAYLAKRPYVFLSYGGDLDILPFRKDAKGRIFSYLLRKALKKADRVLYAMPLQKQSIAKLGLTNAIFFPYPDPIDLNFYKPFNEDKRKELRSKYNADFIFFHPARQEWTCSDTNNKGNDKVFKAFARFIRNSKARTIFIAVEKGRDVEKTKTLIIELGIEKYVKWVKPLNKQGLIELLNTADMCFDNFDYGFYGIAALEALSVGVPTLLYLDKSKLIDQDEPPVINTKSSDEIYEKMIELITDKKKLADIGKNSREWVLEFYHWEKVVDRYLDLYGEILTTHTSTKRA